MRDLVGTIRERRLALGLAITEAARRAEMSREAWTRAESGQARPGAGTLARMASAVRLRVELVPVDDPVPAVGPDVEAARRVVRALRAERVRRGWTLRRAARRAGMSPGALHDLEACRSDPGLSRVAQVATALGLRVTLARMMD